MRRKRSLKDRIFRLGVEPGCPAPRKVPRKLKKEWRNAVFSAMPRYRRNGTRRRIRLRWVPGQGWTMTIIHRAYEVSRSGLCGVSL